MNNIEIFLRKNKLLSDDKQFAPDDVRPAGRGKKYSNLRLEQKNDFFLTVSKKFFFTSQYWNSCWGGIAAISSEGEMIPCVFSRDLSVGNIRKESFRCLIEKLKNRYWFITLDQVEKCCDCEFRYACSDCRALSVNSGLGLFGRPVRCSYNPYQKSKSC
jgi:radical SAM protein with 4Fe4S-binding SPASM domain